MSHVLVFPLLLALGGEPAFPLPNGEHRFQHRFAEHPSMPSIELMAVVRDGRITLSNDTDSNVFPIGTIAEGRLMWHVSERQWIIGLQGEDRISGEIGGCSEGPEVIDPVAMIYWTC